MKHRQKVLSVILQLTQIGHRWIDKKVIVRKTGLDWGEVNRRCTELKNEGVIIYEPKPTGISPKGKPFRKVGMPGQLRIEF